MKRVVRERELQEKMQEAINLLCNTVKTTLGPKGCNVIIDHSAFSPFITNDGVTIAANIESEDAVINTVLELAKEASINTNDSVGDGTTTTLVLLQSIYNYGQKLVIETGINPILLKKELDQCLTKVVALIEEESFQPTESDLENIAITAANSKEIGSLVSTVYNKVKSKWAIRIEEGKEETVVLEKEGYTIDSVLASPYMLKGKDYVRVKEADILLINGCLNDVEEVAEIVNQVIKDKGHLLVISEDYSEYFVKQIMAISLENEGEIYLVKWGEFGKKKNDIIGDLCCITKAQVSEEYCDCIYLGKASEVVITEKECTFNFLENAKIKERKQELEKKLNDNLEVDREFLEKRIAMFNNKVIEIKVGAFSTIERREKKMRFDDSLAAISTASMGVLPGGGVSLYKISEKLRDEGSEKIFKDSLKEILKQLLKNAGLEEETIILNIKNSNYKKLYNVYSNRYEKVDMTRILDAKKVVLKSLVNAVSIATMLLTTTSLIINEYPANIEKDHLMEI